MINLHVNGMPTKKNLLLAIAFDPFGQYPTVQKDGVARIIVLIARGSSLGHVQQLVLQALHYAIVEEVEHSGCKEALSTPSFFFF